MDLLGAFDHNRIAGATPRNRPKIIGIGNPAAKLITVAKPKLARYAIRATFNWDLSKLIGLFLHNKADTVINKEPVPNQPAKFINS